VTSEIRGRCGLIETLLVYLKEFTVGKRILLIGVEKCGSWNLVLMICFDRQLPDKTMHAVSDTVFIWRQINGIFMRNVTVLINYTSTIW